MSKSRVFNLTSTFSHADTYQRTDDIMFLISTIFESLEINIHKQTSVPGSQGTDRQMI